jgi:uncharacterized protein (TIGR03083 family)
MYAKGEMSRLPAGSEPILCAPLLRKVDDKLIELLSSLDPAEWDLPTIAPRWKVREVAAHLLDTALHKLSLVRDRCAPEPIEIRSPRDLIALVDRLNSEGVTVFRRLSPPVLIDMMKIACVQSADFHESLNPFETAAFNVSWAGEAQSLNWFDTARELTERWHHQQQIRVATNRPGIMTPELYHPVLDCFVRGLPHLYRDADAPLGTTIELAIAGECGGDWYLAKGNGNWGFAEPSPQCAARVVLPQEIAWRVFTKGIDRSAALTQTAIRGDTGLGEKILQLRAIVG